jgi:hypothetical protein
MHYRSDWLHAAVEPNLHVGAGDKILLGPTTSQNKFA